MLKNAFDYCVALVGLIVLAPLLFAIALLIVMSNGWPIFFLQERPGKLGIPFKIIKFRTMSVERSGVIDPEKDSVRITRLGRLLRATSLDELPELINVLKGEMSLVGPRPLLMEYLARYTPEQSRRHLIKPGITGWAQINGRNAISWDEKFAMDTWYVDNQSFFLDLKILALTFGKVVGRRGISHGDHATMPSFKGKQ
jgi:lipopolysaccharide/colanic/teichoic acid biosynthesis glycosyltransferase